MAEYTRYLQSGIAAAGVALAGVSAGGGTCAISEDRLLSLAGGSARADSWKSGIACTVPGCKEFVKPLTY
jgi:hypothetical protein